MQFSRSQLPEHLWGIWSHCFARFPELMQLSRRASFGRAKKAVEGADRRPPKPTATELHAWQVFNPAHNKVSLHARLQPVTPSSLVPSTSSLVPAAVAAPPGGPEAGVGLELGNTSYDFAMQIKPRQAMRLALRATPGQSIDGTQSFAILSHAAAVAGGGAPSYPLALPPGSTSLPYTPNRPPGASSCAEGASGAAPAAGGASACGAVNGAAPPPTFLRLDPTGLPVLSEPRNGGDDDDDDDDAASSLMEDGHAGIRPG